MSTTLENLGALAAQSRQLLDAVRGGEIADMKAEHVQVLAEFATAYNEAIAGFETQYGEKLTEFNQEKAQKFAETDTKLQEYQGRVETILGEAANRLNPFFSRVDTFVQGRLGIAGHVASYKPEIPVCGYVLWTIPDYAAGDRQSNIGFSGEIRFHRYGWSQLSNPIKISAHAAYAGEHSYLINERGESVENYAGLRFETMLIDGKQTRVLFCERSGSGTILFNGIVHRGGNRYNKDLHGIETRNQFFGYAIKRNADLSYSVNTDKNAASDMLLDIARRAK